MRLMYLDPTLFGGAERSIEPEEFSSPLLGRFYGVLRDKAAAGGSLSMASLSGSFTPEEIDHLTGILLKPEVLANGRQALADYIAVIREERQLQNAADDLLAFAAQKRKQLQAQR